MISRSTRITTNMIALRAYMLGETPRRAEPYTAMDRLFTAEPPVK